MGVFIWLVHDHFLNAIQRNIIWFTMKMVCPFYVYFHWIFVPIPIATPKKFSFHLITFYLNIILFLLVQIVIIHINSHWAMSIMLSKWNSSFKLLNAYFNWYYRFQTGIVIECIVLQTEFRMSGKVISFYCACNIVTVGWK